MRYINLLKLNLNNLTTQPKNEVHQPSQAKPQQSHDIAQPNNEVQPSQPKPQQSHDIAQPKNEVHQPSQPKPQQSHDIAQPNNEVHQPSQAKPQQSHDIAQPNNEVHQPSQAKPQQSHNIAQPKNEVHQPSQAKPQQSHDIAQPNNEVLYRDSQPSFEQTLCNAPINSKQSNFGQSPQDVQPIRQCLDNTNSNSEQPHGDTQSIHMSRQHFESNSGQPLDVEHHAFQPTHNSLYDAQPDSGQSFDVTQPNAESSLDYVQESDAQDDYTEDSLPMESHSIQSNEDCFASEQSLSIDQHNPLKSWHYVAHPDLELSYYLQCDASRPITLKEFHTFRLTSNFGRPLPLLSERFLPLEYLLINGIVDYVPAYMRFPVRPYYRRIQTLPTATLIPIPEYSSVDFTSETSDSSSTNEQSRIEEPKQIVRTTSFSRVVYSKSHTEQSRSEELNPKPMIRTTSFSRVDYSKVQSTKETQSLQPSNPPTKSHTEQSTSEELNPKPMIRTTSFSRVDYSKVQYTKETQSLQPSNPPTNMTYSGESNRCSSVRSYLRVKEDTPIACPLAISFRCYISAANYEYDDTSSESVSYISNFEEFDEGISSILSENRNRNGVNIEDVTESNKSNENIESINYQEKCKLKKKNNKRRKLSFFKRFKAKIIFFLICK